MTELTDEELEQTAERFEKWADEVDPSRLDWKDGSDLRAVAEATDAVGAAEQRQLEAVAQARANGRSWSRIVIGLRVTRQAARQRLADKVETVNA